MIAHKVKIDVSDITYGPKELEIDDPLVVMCHAEELKRLGYRRVSNAYCMVSRIDRDDWLEVMARQLNTCVAHFYNMDGSGVSDRWRDHYIRGHSKDTLTVSPSILRKVPSY